MQAHDRLLPAQTAALFAIATLSSWALGPDGPRYWDSHGYVVQAIDGHAGGLMLGRPAFVLASHGVTRVWIALGGTLRDVEALLRNFWMLVSASSAPALAWLTVGIGAPARVAWTAGLLLALSPVVAHTNRAVLTDGPAMALALVALALGAEASSQGSTARMGAAGAALGLAAGMREPSLAHGATLLGLVMVSRAPPGRRVTMALAAGIGCAGVFLTPVLWFLATQRGYGTTVAQWLGEMGRERSAHPYTARDLGMFVVWALAAGPVPWVALATRRRHTLATLHAAPRAAVVVGASALQLAALAFYQDIAFSPRYLLAALPGALMVPGAWALDNARWRQAALAASVVFTALAAPTLRWREAPLRDALRTLPSKLDTVGDNAMVVSGQVCPAVVYERTLRRLEGRRSELVQVCPGWRWPSQLETHLEAHRRQGHPVVIDLRDAVWIGERQRRARNEARDYVQRHQGAPGVIVWR